MPLPSSNHINLSDAELLKQYYEDNDSEWLGILLQRYTLLLLGVCMKYLKQEEEAKDAVQQIFLKAIAELQKYPVTYFKSWLYMVARNYCLMLLRDNGKNNLPVNDFMVASTPDDNITKIEHQREDETYIALNEALNELNSEQKQCIDLFYLQKKSYNEIASLTGFSIMKVKSCIQNGKRNLKNRITKKMKQKEMENS